MLIYVGRLWNGPRDDRSFRISSIVFGVTTTFEVRITIDNVRKGAIAHNGADTETIDASALRSLNNWRLLTSFMYETRSVQMFTC
jgi:hypothetical protein